MNIASTNQLLPNRWSKFGGLKRHAMARGKWLVADQAISITLRMALCRWGSQIVPASGNAPSLLEGRVYSYEFATAAGMPAHGDFEIRNGQAFKVRVPHNCIVTGDRGKKIDTPCTYYKNRRNITKPCS